MPSLPNGCSRTSFPLFDTKSLNLHQTENTHPSLFLVRDDVTTALGGVEAIRTPQGSEPRIPSPRLQPDAPFPRARPGSSPQTLAGLPGQSGGEVSWGSPPAAAAEKRPRARQALTRQLVRLQPGLGV